MAADVPMVTVIIPTYNRAHLLGRSIGSVLNQTYSDFELIVVDDGSTDNTTEVVRSFCDTRLKYIRCERNSGGPATPTNVGIEAASTRYIAVQDSDDEWLPDKLQQQVTVINSAPPAVGVVYTDAWRIEDDGSRQYFRSPHIMPEDGIVYSRALDYGVANIGTWSLLMKRECFDRAGLFDPRLRMYIDTELLMRVSRYFLFHHIAQPLVNYHATAGSLVNSRRAAISARMLILEEFAEDIEKDGRLLGKHYCGIGILLCEDGQVKQGGPYLAKAFRSHPSLLGSLILWPVKRSLLHLMGMYRTIRIRLAGMHKGSFVRPTG